MSVHVIGVDPGPIPGFVRLEVVHGRVLRIDILQSTHLMAPEVLRVLLPAQGKCVVAIERFVVSNRSGRSSTAGAGDITRSMIGALELEAHRAGASVVLRSASQAKAWATDARLDRLNLINPTKTMRHARDAARHALFEAASSSLIADPLSKDFLTQNGAL